MKERPILFSTPMVQAILDGRKTMTRRIIKSNHESGLFQVNTAQYEPDFPGYYHNRSVNSIDWDESFYKTIICPYGSIGDILWVRETWQWDWVGVLRKNKVYFYKATTTNEFLASGEKWRPSIFMPKEACRLRLQITDIGVERVQDISEEDAKAEGALKMHIDDLGQTWETHKRGFESLWQKINGPESWEANPWAWVISFETIHP
jgi:hypothetical protein